MGEGAWQPGYVSGHVPLDPDGSVVQPLGKARAEVSGRGLRGSAPYCAGEDRQPQARFGRSGPGDGLAEGLRDGQYRVGLQPSTERHQRLFRSHPRIVRSRGWGHARSAVGMAGLPLGVPVEIEAEVEVSG